MRGSVTQSDEEMDQVIEFFCCRVEGVNEVLQVGRNDIRNPGQTFFWWLLASSLLSHSRCFECPIGAWKVIF